MDTIHKDESSSGSPRSEATVLQVFQESDTVKRIVLLVDDKNAVSFKAGQWVDLFIPGVSIFTGFSMCSAPHHLQDSGRLELAVKYSDYPPTLWVHKECKTGDKVQIRVGGTFFHEIQADAPAPHLLLLAAGIGINPMHSIYQHFIHTQHQRQRTQESRGITNDAVTGRGRLCLLYSAQTPQELVFKDSILSKVKTCPNANVHLFCTRQHTQGGDDKNMSNGRITASAIHGQIVTMNRVRLQAYICGPPGFIDGMERHCLGEGLAQNQIHYEKWW